MIFRPRHNREESFASGVDVLFEFGIVQHVPWTWVSSVNGKQVLVDVDQAPGITWELSLTGGALRCNKEFVELYNL